MGRHAPNGLGKPGQKLWKAVVDDFDLAEHEAAQLEEAARVRDTIAALRDLIERDGLMISSSQGSRLHPAVAEVRQQQLALARMLATLDVPVLQEDDLPASSGVRPLRAVG